MTPDRHPKTYHVTVPVTLADYNVGLLRTLLDDVQEFAADAAGAQHARAKIKTKPTGSELTLTFITTNNDVLLLERVARVVALYIDGQYAV